MTLTPGARVGGYEVVELLGAGGMGEVYRARDTRLHRDVAIKTVPDLFLDDPERAARLEREAQALATLNHPHIASIYGVEESPSIAAAGSRPARLLILEFVDGQSLAERLASGPLPAPQAIVIARQIADALEQAHDRGIIHRDLKPANIMLTADDQAKVLDFGLARGLEAAAPAAMAQSPTMTLNATSAGVVLGTAAYLSPEQIKGRPADKRSDVWAFGCVLFEMLTGARPFRGDTIPDVLGSIVRDEPDYSAIPASVPAAVRRLVERCLHKDRQQRIHEMAVARFILEETPSGAVSALAEPGARARARMRMLAAAATGLVAGCALGVIAVTRLAPANDPQPPEPVRLPIDSANAPVFVEQQVDTNRPLALSDDGRHLVYAGLPVGRPTPQLIVRSFGQTEASVLASTNGAVSPFFSPDGDSVGFLAPDGVWRKVSRAGGTPHDLWRNRETGRGAAWLPDNSILIATAALATGLIRVPAEGGEPTVLTRPAQGEFDHVTPSALPGNKAVLFTVQYSTNPQDSAIAVLDLATRQWKTLIKGGLQAQYVKTGHLVYAVPGALRAIRFDLTRLAVTGDSVPVLDGVATTSIGGAYSVAPDGTLAFLSGGAAAARQRSLVWADRTGTEESLGADHRAYTHPRLSQDGTRLAVITRDQEADLWLWTFSRRTLSKLSVGAAQELNPVWLPGGRELLLASTRDTPTANVFKVRADGSGNSQPLTSSAHGLYPISVTPDGSRAIVVDFPPSRLMGLSVLNVAKPAEPEPLLSSDYRYINGELSPDGRLLAYQSNETGREEIYVRPFPDVNLWKAPVSIDGGTKPVWSRAGNELFFMDLEGYVMAAAIGPVPAFKAGVPQRVLKTPYYAAELGRTFDVSADGKRFLMLKDMGRPREIVLVLNWGRELRRLLPH